MSLRLALMLLLLPVALAYAQGIDTAGDNPNPPPPSNPTPAPSSNEDTRDDWHYLSDNPNAFGIPSGALGVGIVSSNTLFPTTAVANAPTDEDISNLQGCGGVGQADYTSALFNMPEVFDKFKQDVNSELAKQILTYNYSLPQTAALFDTLNSYGNARYQQFQQACKLDSLKQDAKNQYMAACIKVQLPDRRNLVTQALQNAKTAMASASTVTPPAGTITSPNKVSDIASAEQIESQAYAQAWEICAMQYASDSKSLAARKDSNTKFIQTLRDTENVNVAIQPLVCPVSSTVSVGSDGFTQPAANQCWINLLIPQVRLCNGADLSTGCTPTSDYGVKEPLVGITAYLDLLRFIMANGVIDKLAESLSADLIKNNVDPATQKLAAANTVLNLARVARPTTTSNDETTRAFQQNYLSCNSSDIAYPLNRYREAINATFNRSDMENPGSVPITLPTNVNFSTSDYKKIIDTQLKLPTGGNIANDKAALVDLTEAALGCTANQTIPIFDPNITASLNTQCSDDDWDAFYTMSSYDVSMAATRDIYRFINLRLKQAYSRLLNEQGAGIKQTTTDTNGNTVPVATMVDSPEIRARLARAIKEVMLPSVETQIQRLDELERSRGAFAQRVRQIYADKHGCVYREEPTSFPSVQPYY